MAEQAQAPDGDTELWSSESTFPQELVVNSSVTTAFTSAKPLSPSSQRPFPNRKKMQEEEEEDFLFHFYHIRQRELGTTLAFHPETGGLTGSLHQNKWPYFIAKPY